MLRVFYYLYYMYIIIYLLFTLFLHMILCPYLYRLLKLLIWVFQPISVAKIVDMMNVPIHLGEIFEDGLFILFNN